MNGSNGAVGRQGPASALEAAGLKAAEVAQLEDGDWPWFSHGHCLLCQMKREATTSCEQEGRVEAVRGRIFFRPPGSRPEHRTICKQCCIRLLDGHGCPWWSLCWRDQESRREM
jgi:hypothetical protein